MSEETLHQEEDFLQDPEVESLYKDYTETSDQIVALEAHYNQISTSRSITKAQARMLQDTYGVEFKLAIESFTNLPTPVNHAPAKDSVLKTIGEKIAQLWERVVAFAKKIFKLVSDRLKQAFSKMDADEENLQTIVELAEGGFLPARDAVVAGARATSEGGHFNHSHSDVWRMRIVSNGDPMLLGFRTRLQKVGPILSKLEAQLLGFQQMWSQNTGNVEVFKRIDSEQLSNELVQVLDTLNPYNNNVRSQFTAGEKQVMSLQIAAKGVLRQKATILQPYIADPQFARRISELDKKLTLTLPRAKLDTFLDPESQTLAQNSLRATQTALRHLASVSGNVALFSHARTRLLEELVHSMKFTKKQAA